MKRKIRLNEAQLNRIIKKSVNRVLKESSVLHCSVKPFEQIKKFANEIMDTYEYTQEDNYESDDSFDVNASVYKWAKKVANDAQEWIGMNSSYTPIDNQNYYY